jgi:hypothetical protein
MRIGYLGFTEEADLLLPAPSEVTYLPASQVRQEVTTSGLRELRGYTHLAAYTLQLQWRDLPEEFVSLVASIPPDEVVTLLDEAGREWQVVFGEPTRTMLTGVSTRDGKPLYSTGLAAYPVISNSAGTSRVLGTGGQVRSGRLVAPETATPRDPVLPPVPSPEVSPVLARASRGLPPTVRPGEGVRFTFTTFSDEVERGRYYAEDGEGYLELTRLTGPRYQGLYSSVANQRLVEARLRRFPWQLDAAWSVGVLLFVDSALTPGRVLWAEGKNALLQVTWDAGLLSLDLALGTIHYRQTWAVPAGEYIYLGLQYSHGVLRAGLAGVLDTVPSFPSHLIETSSEGLVVGGGAVYLDDLLLARTDGVDLAQAYHWMVNAWQPST